MIEQNPATDDELVDTLNGVAVLRGAPAESIARRVRAAGARGHLELMGVGMSGVVLCDGKGRAFKVARHESPSSLSSIEDEAEWLRVASKVPEVAPHVARFRSWHPDEGVLVRDCVDGRPGGWSHEGRLYELHERIGKAMMEHGWGPPEFKGDSYVMRESDNKPILVDAGMAIRFGKTLLRYAREVVAGTRRWPDPPGNVAFALRDEMAKGRLTEREAGELEETLQAMSVRATG